MADDMTALVDNQNRNSFVKTPIQFSIGVDDDCISELMRIEITVYSMQGICRKIQRKGGKPPKPSAGNTADFSKNSGFTPPTTALISLRGEVVHTVVPSIPLKFNEGKKGKESVRGSAFWQSNVVSEGATNEDYIASSTFVLKRAMRRQCFQPNGSIKFMSHYQPERVDFVIGVGKGKNMYPLGIASIAISGEEEAEQLTNAPIRSIYEKDGKRKNGHKKGLFFDGESHYYGLSNNAILRVGVRVIPEHNYIPKTLENGTRVTKKQEDCKFIELNDENSLIAEFKEAQEQLEKEISTPKNVHRSNPPAFGLLNCSFPFCGAIELPFSSVASSQTLNTKPPDATNKISEARVLSMRVISDVSGSTFRWLSRQTSAHHEA
jgi:hypothetical protein